MAVVTNALVGGDLVQYEAPSYYSRSVGVLVASKTVVVGSILKGALATVEPAAAADHATITCISLANATTGGGETLSIPVLIRHSVVSKETTVYSDAGVDANGIAKLLTLGIVVRDNVADATLAESIAAAYP